MITVNIEETINPETLLTYYNVFIDGTDINFIVSCDINGNLLEWIPYTKQWKNLEGNDLTIVKAALKKYNNKKIKDSIKIR